MMKYIFIILLLFMSGCVSTGELTPENCGPEPTMAQAVWGVQYFVQHYGLKDPDSAQIRNIQIVRRYGQANIHGTIYGWLVTFELNAKNSFGAYTGYHKKEVIMLDGGTRVWFNTYQPDLAF